MDHTIPTRPLALDLSHSYLQNLLSPTASTRNNRILDTSASSRTAAFFSNKQLSKSYVTNQTDYTPARKNHSFSHSSSNQSRSKYPDSWKQYLLPEFRKTPQSPFNPKVYTHRLQQHSSSHSPLHSHSSLHGDTSKISRKSSFSNIEKARSPFQSSIYPSHSLIKVSDFLLQPLSSESRLTHNYNNQSRNSYSNINSPLVPKFSHMHIQPTKSTCLKTSESRESVGQFSSQTMTAFGKLGDQAQTSCDLPIQQKISSVRIFGLSKIRSEPRTRLNDQEKTDRTYLIREEEAEEKQKPTYSGQEYLVIRNQLLREEAQYLRDKFTEFLIQKYRPEAKTLY